MKPAYYNEFHKPAAAWLRELIRRGLIARGDVDERSITEVQPDDLRPYGQCHFFAGIGGWSLALRLAGVPDDRPVWTGSCPCQPFSAAGSQRGSDDERHLWPAFADLIRKCRPGIVFGEQVAGAAGSAWWDHVAADLEAANYAAAAANLGAHSVGAPHIRQRLVWVGKRLADPDEITAGQRRDAGSAQGAGLSCGLDADGRGLHGSLADAGCERVQQRRGYDLASPARGDESDAQERERLRAEPGAGFDSGDVGHATGIGRSGWPGLGAQGHGSAEQQPQDAGASVLMADPASRGLGIDGSASGQAGHAAQRDGDSLDNAERAGLEGHRADQGSSGRVGAAGSTATAGALDLWRGLEWIECSDGKARPVKPGIFPLAARVRDRVVPSSDSGTPGDANDTQEARVMRLHGYGNAIVPPLAAVFIRAAL
jgi:DNA (cytosine-5)-methyltransferase 1